MKKVALLPVALACLVAPVQAADAVLVAESVAVEEAWARFDPTGVIEVYLVVNNTSAAVAALRIDIPGAGNARMVNAAGRTLEPSIPIHSELYMEPGGVRIVATGVSAASTVPVAVTVGTGTPVVVVARVLGDGQAVPDHHDYVHG